MNTVGTTTVKYIAKHMPGEHPNHMFETEAEARAFVRGYAFGCGHDGPTEPCRGALAEWEIKSIRHH